jgi:hypothetical protein
METGRDLDRNHHRRRRIRLLAARDMNDQGYTVTLEGFIATLGDLFGRLRDATNAGDEVEMHDILDDLEDELDRADDFIKAKRSE